MKEDTLDETEERPSDSFSSVMFICNYYDTIRTEIDLNAEKLITYQFTDKKDQNAINDINVYREKLMEHLSACEKLCISNCKQNLSKFNQKISEVFDANSNGHALIELKKDLLLSKSIFFVKIFKVKFPNYFGSLVAVNFYLNDELISIIKYLHIIFDL